MIFENSLNIINFNIIADFGNSDLCLAFDVIYDREPNRSDVIGVCTTEAKFSRLHQW